VYTFVNAHMRKIIDKDIIPLLISAILLIISIGVILFTENSMNYKLYVGIGLIGISLVLYFKNNNLYIFVFGLTLILGVINLIEIYYLNIIFGIGPIEFNPIFLALLIGFLGLNKELLNKISKN